MYLLVGVTILEFAADLIIEFNSSLGHLGWDSALKVSGLAILIVMTLHHTCRPGRVSVKGHGLSRRLLADPPNVGVRI
jgi:hypothetical protein